MTDVTWGIASTILAPTRDILQFAAYHLAAGAHRIYIYLDAPNPQAFEFLDAHPKIRVITCDDKYWKQRKRDRPDMHQVRQTANATHAYNRRAEVDWLIHMDADEFLVADRPVAEILAERPADPHATRIRPMEQLSGNPSAFKGFIPSGPDRARITADLYPTYGAHVKGGFLSHLAGKVFVRTGLPKINIRIHNVFQDGEMLDCHDPQDGIDLAHVHAKTWEDWIAAYRYRVTKGSYRSELGPNKPYEKGGLSMHDLFTQIEQDAGEAGLCAFFDEVCADSPALRKRLADHGLLHEAKLDLVSHLGQHFPDYTGV
ncbi:glycosyltransferase family 2 protein [Sulfitobacter sp. CW3]|uniref:glycosyltransferase family 2 protein n=1 Tax=Sulfitobacter sp. CW3 TaxID=2861965 RepID=UPI001C5EE8BC|nr:glycosyltransferase family 2 protein [Sulfitobacter sp. CW3]MBW4960572.1 glycosyltransferase family 2 protein [Sulfitobacter sp. CW3]